MINYTLIGYCILAAGGYLLVISLLLDFIERRLRLTEGIPEEILESSDLGATITNFIMEVLFYVIIPALGYSFFYLIIPLWGIRAGMAATLFAFMLGAAPTIMSMSVRVKMPITYLLFFLLAFIIKLGGSLAIIAYLYSL